MVEQSKTNGKAVSSLTFGILSILIPFIGFILGIIGILLSLKSTKDIQMTDETGGALAVSGLVCSIVGIVIQLFVLLGIISFLYITVH